MRIAFHFDPPLAEIPSALEAEGVDAFQTTLRDPKRFGKQGVPEPEDRERFREQADPAGLWGIAHATLLTNLASAEGRIRNASKSALVGDLKLAAEIGLEGVCFHLGYEKGYASRREALEQAIRKLGQAVEAAPEGARPILENTCEGGELADSVDEVRDVIEAIGAPPERLGILIDTCHLFAAGFELADEGAGERLADALGSAGLLERLAGFHLNDSKGPRGGRLDRHAPPGEGEIGDGLLSVAAHEAFRDRPAILEISLEASRRAKKYLEQAG